MNTQLVLDNDDWNVFSVISETIDLFSNDVFVELVIMEPWKNDRRRQVITGVIPDLCEELVFSKRSFFCRFVVNQITTLKLLGFQEQLYSDSGIDNYQQIKITNVEVLS